MISREPTIERLATARQLLLEPFGLDETHLARALAEIRSHQVDDADLYFQYTRAEGWSLEEGIVKTGSFSIDQGVGVRAVSGEKTAFAYSDDISEASLLDAARTVRSISSATQTRRVKAGAQKIAQSRSLYPELDPISTLDSTAKVELLGKVEKLARAKDPRVVQVMAGLASEYDVVLVARADGTLAADVRPLVRLSVSVLVEEDGKRERGASGGGGWLGGLLSAAFGGTKATTPTFDGGGFTGYGSRSGGIDGKGGFPAILHPNETVLDHTRGQVGPSGSQNYAMTIDLRGTTGDRELDAKIARAGQAILAQVPSAMQNHQMRDG